MFRQAAPLVIAVIAALAGYLWQRSPVYDPPLFSARQGRNNTALFMVHMLNGLSNVQIATMQALRENHPEIEIHAASWAMREAKVKRISELAPTARPIEFHTLQTQDYLQAVFRRTTTISIVECIHKPGILGWSKFQKFWQAWISPWEGPEHMALVEELGSIIEKTDPAVVIQDVFLRPAIDAARQKNRLEVFISPNTLSDNFQFMQPWAAGFWKYPPMASGLQFPVHWTKIPENFLQTIMFRYTMSWTPARRDIIAYLKERGLKNANTDWFNVGSFQFAPHTDKNQVYRPDTPWISQTLPEASTPVEVVPANVTCVGPMLVKTASVNEQDPELTTWLSQAPTLLINLGATVSYPEDYAMAMHRAISQILDQPERYQVLWKFQRDGQYSDDDFNEVAGRHVASGRLRRVNWLEADPSAILESGHIAASVHHGGSGCYHEALAAGVPQIVLPLWADLYNFAQLVPRLNIGKWACQESSPIWTASCLHDAFSTVLSDTGASQGMRAEARRLGRIARDAPGRVGAAQIIASLAATGY